MEKGTEFIHSLPVNRVESRANSLGELIARINGL
ncbi:hypothetical protein Xmir_01448 [Xenorhabdus miraniensis]|uniref:Uncharacterized protein n=1 Tax=Xenorhabdus miraniensis TaxID=351674 RepID=A0A2D0JT69_9GAMM|nr:hypothetical protein Xmir_01448 [Xenorhabdus miraniensis]